MAIPKAIITYHNDINGPAIKTEVYLSGMKLDSHYRYFYMRGPAVDVSRGAAKRRRG